MSNTTTLTKHFYAGGLQVAKMVGTGVYYLHADVLGSTRLEVTPTLTVVYSSNYKPYGPAYQLTGSELFRYVGDLYDTVTNLYYMGARFYDPTIGRFVTEDSYNGTKEEPLSQNRYVYAVDDPMRYVDPSGHMIDAGNDGGGAISPAEEFLLLVGIGAATTTITRTTTTTTEATTATTTITTSVLMPDGTTLSFSLTISESTIGWSSVTSSCSGDTSSCGQLMNMTPQQLENAYWGIAAIGILPGPGVAAAGALAEIVTGETLGDTAFGIIVGAAIGGPIVAAILFVAVNYYACGNWFCSF